MECADFVEIDVRVSRVNELVVIHDSFLERTTLDEVLDLIEGNGLIIEVKESGSEEKICSVIKERGFENRNYFLKSI